MKADGVKLTLSESIKLRQQEGCFPVISEVKVRSEKEGDLLRGRDPAQLARQMAEQPVAGISVVTEPEHFGGSMDILRAVADAVSVPILRKDFITTERQVEESADYGASAVLLITAMLEADRMTRLIEKARVLGLESLVEAHNLEEIIRVSRLGFDLMGINNRDITIFEVDDDDVSRTETLARACRSGRLLISESSIGSAADVRRAGKSGADAVLVGTALLKPDSPGELLSEMIAVGWPV